MCIGAPEMKSATQYQASKDPVRRESSNNNNQGRKGTILTGSSAVGDTAVTGKKTALGS